MPNNFCFFFSHKTGAFIMAFINFMGGASLFIAGCVGLHNDIAGSHNATLSTCSVLLGIIIFCTGLLLTVAIIKAKERLVLLYLLIGCSNLFIVSVYAGINMFEHTRLIFMFLGSLILWYCQYCIYGFYGEMLDFNTVKAGAIEITYKDKGEINEVMWGGSIDDSAV